MTEVKKGDKLYDLTWSGTFHSVRKVRVVGVGKLEIHVVPFESGKYAIKTKHGRTQIDDKDRMWCRLFSDPIVALECAQELNDKNQKKIMNQQIKIRNTIKDLRQ